MKTLAIIGCFWLGWAGAFLNGWIWCKIRLQRQGWQRPAPYCVTWTCPDCGTTFRLDASDPVWPLETLERVKAAHECGGPL